MNFGVMFVPSAEFGSTGPQKPSGRDELKLYFHLREGRILFLFTKSSSGEKDSVLLSFDEAKCSIVEYEAETGGLHTVRVRYYPSKVWRRTTRACFEPCLQSRCTFFKRKD